MKTTKEIRRILRSVDFFSPLTDKELDVIAAHSECRNFGANQAVFSVGDPGNCLYVLAEGEVLVTKPTEERQSRDLARLIAGDSFGELEFFSSRQRTADARATKDSRLLMFPGGGVEFEELLAQYPQVLARALHSFITLIAGRIRSVNQLVSENSPWVQDLKKQVFTDKLTGLLNAAYLDESLPEFRGETSLVGGAVVMVKPDNFKEINDRFGHDPGDLAIIRLGRLLSDWAPQPATVLRYRGNEFCVLVPATNESGVRAFAEEVCSRIRELDWQEITKETELRVTVNVAVAFVGRDGATARELSDKAHELVFALRSSGGNRVGYVTDTE
ncbi:MAG: GGDEF domain-containing protein [Spirochaeta sp.]|nr:GGDEF domain-containing protein [Spirochaeta sp.]